MLASHFSWVKEGCLKEKRRQHFKVSNITEYYSVAADYKREPSAKLAHWLPPSLDSELQMFLFVILCHLPSSQKAVMAVCMRGSYLSPQGEAIYWHFPCCILFVEQDWITAHNGDSPLMPHHAEEAGLPVFPIQDFPVKNGGAVASRLQAVDCDECTAICGPIQAEGECL